MRVWQAHSDDPDKLEYFDLTGFLQPGYIFRLEDSQSKQLLNYNDSEFWLQRARIGFRAQLTKYFILRLELEMAGTPELTDAYVESDVKPWLRFRAGQFLMAFLRTFQFYESDLAFNDHVLYVPQDNLRDPLQYLSPRDIGFMVLGQIGDLSPSAHLPVLEYWIGAFNGGGANHTDNPDSAYMYTARAQLDILGLPKGAEAESDIARNPTPKVAVGGGVYMNCDPLLNVDRGWTTDAELRWQGLFVSASLVRFHVGAAGGKGSLDQALGYSHCAAGAAASNHVAVGASVQAQYALPQFLFPLKGQVLELLSRWDYVDGFAPPGSLLGNGIGSPGYTPPTSFTDPTHPPASWRVTLGFNWFPTGKQNLRLAVNYELNHLVEPVQLTDGSQITSISNNALWIQITAGI